MASLAEEYPQQQQRLRELVREYDGLPLHAGSFASYMIRQTLGRAEHAAMSGDVVAIIRSFEEMKGCE